MPCYCGYMLKVPLSSSTESLANPEDAMCDHSDSEHDAGDSENSGPQALAGRYGSNNTEDSANDQGGNTHPGDQAVLGEGRPQTRLVDPYADMETESESEDSDVSIISIEEEKADRSVTVLQQRQGRPILSEDAGATSHVPEDEDDQAPGPSRRRGGRSAVSRAVRPRPPKSKKRKT